MTPAVDTQTTSAYSGAIPDIPLLTEIEPLFSAPMSINMSETYRVWTQTFVRLRVRYGLSLVWPPPDTQIKMLIARLSIKSYIT